MQVDRFIYSKAWNVISSPKGNFECFVFFLIPSQELGTRGIFLICIFIVRLLDLITVDIPQASWLLVQTFNQGSKTSTLYMVVTVVTVLTVGLSSSDLIWRTILKFHALQRKERATLRRSQALHHWRTMIPLVIIISEDGSGETLLNRANKTVRKSDLRKRALLRSFPSLVLTIMETCTIATWQLIWLTICQPKGITRSKRWSFQGKYGKEIHQLVLKHPPLAKLFGTSPTRILVTEELINGLKAFKALPLFKQYWNEWEKDPKLWRNLVMKSWTRDVRTIVAPRVKETEWFLCLRFSLCS
jgi:hypothetical protein